MVSTDHFRHELLAQLGRAATQGRIDLLINSGELCRSVTRGSSGSASYCDAMQEEFKMGDTLLLDRTNGAGMTVSYLLPRTAFKSAYRSNQTRPPRISALTS
jgi:UDP-N-acetylmuramyl pentapeptide synthase